MNHLLLTPALFRLLCGLVEERTGVHYTDDKLELFSARVCERLADAGFASPLDYYYFLRYDAASTAEFDLLVNELVVNETYFFREVEQLRALRDEVLRPLIERGLRPRVWCAASSTGEEALSVAMLLAEAGLLAQVDIVASDISTKALARARSGAHSNSSLRATPPALQERFLSVKEGRVEVAAEIREKIDWRHVNLLDTEGVAALGTFDCILCRNVLIYFRDETIRQLVRTLSNALREGGRLFVGASESLLRFGTVLRCEERRGAFSYSRMAP
jgi:chemotaxis protein methyltransferase CheR